MYLTLHVNIDIVNTKCYNLKYQKKVRWCNLSGAMKRIRLDNDIVLYFKKLASEQKVPYQTLISALLRKQLQEV